MEFISEEFFGKYLVIPPLRALFGRPVQKKIALMKKIFLQLLVEIILDISKFIFGVLGPPTNVWNIFSFIPSHSTFRTPSTKTIIFLL